MSLHCESLLVASSPKKVNILTAIKLQSDVLSPKGEKKRVLPLRHSESGMLHAAIEEKCSLFYSKEVLQGHLKLQVHIAKTP